MTNTAKEVTEMKNYGYARISTKTQNIERQKRNILAACPDAVIVEEAFTGTKVEGRAKLLRLLKTVKPGDTIYFDSVSRMSRNAAEGVELYEKLYKEGINLVFLKEPYINTDTYREASRKAIPMTGTTVDYILEGINRYMIELAKEQVRLAFEQAQKEVDDLRQRTKEGIETARLNNKQIGQQHDRKLAVKKAEAAKIQIREKSKTFGGILNDTEMMKLTGISKPSLYKYKREILAEMRQEMAAAEQAAGFQDKPTE